MISLQIVFQLNALNQVFMFQATKRKHLSDYNFDLGLRGANIEF